MKDIVIQLTIVVLVVFLWIGGCSRYKVQRDPEKLQPVSTLVEDLLEAETFIQEDKPKKAQKLVQEWMKDHPESEMMDQAIFLHGRALFERKRYYQAAMVYEGLLEEYPTTRYFEEALKQEVEIARLFLAGKKRIVWRFIPVSAKTEGLEILERVAEHWPGSELAAQAMMMQADYYYAKKRYLEAQEIYQQVVDQYPRSQYYADAMFGSAQATHDQYRGPKYDASELIDAQIRYQRCLAEFPELSRQKGFPERLAEIIDQQAAKEYEIADFYRRTHKREAACYYWTNISQQWSHTEWSRLAEESLQKYQEP